jgi:predicted MFS family arabinose efflux permease
METTTCPSDRVASLSQAASHATCDARGMAVTRVGARLAALRELWANPGLRRAELAWGGFHAAEWASLVALAVVAFASDGAGAVGVVLFARMVPSAFVAPLVAVAGDRAPRERILLVAHFVRAVACLGAALALLLDTQALVVYVFAVLAAVPLAAHRPCHLALAPLLARTPRELAASNVAALTFESAAVLCGPLLAAILLAVWGPAAVFGACAALSAGSFFLIGGVRPARVEGVGVAASTVARELREGVAAVAGNRPVRLVVGLFGSQALVRGVLGVLLVVIAIDLLGLGEPGVGILTAAFGVGGLIGAVAGIGLVGRGGLGRPFQLALAGWGLPLALIGVWPDTVVAVVCLAFSGFANSLLDVSGFTSMQEHTDDRVIGRVFGLFELVVIGAVALGSLLGPLGIDLIGARGTLAVAGGLLVALALLCHAPLGRLDEGTSVRGADVELLQRTSIFGPLPYVTLRRLAASLEERQALEGEAVVTQGEPGELVYVIAAGQALVSRDGEAIRELGPGDVFGELALMLDVPRTATVTALEPVQLRALAREPFLAAVTGNQLSTDALRRLIAARAPREAGVAEGVLEPSA